uniref:Uncharacterized protein n=1 Tax=viral metagenome TaxID=1070528 RepID=A0A6M3L4I3_9ZZZZ
MSDKALISMSVEELREEVSRVDSELSELARWTALAGTEYGQFLMRDKRERLAMVSRLYGSVDMGTEGARTRIARIQGFEEYLRMDLAKLEDAEKVRKSLARHAQQCHTILNERLKARTETTDDIVSGAIKEK